MILALGLGYREIGGNYDYYRFIRTSLRIKYPWRSTDNNISARRRALFQLSP